MQKIITPTKLSTTGTCSLRKDLSCQGISVPVGRGYKSFGQFQKVAYRWRSVHRADDTFEIRVNGMWQEANSIDFEFE
jgi:hypothetical protein